MIRQSFSTGCFSLAGECKSYDCTNYRIFSGDLGRDLSHIDVAIDFCYSQREQSGTIVYAQSVDKSRGNRTFS